MVQKLWNYCNLLRDDGLSYGDYVEQLTFLLFLKMADEQTRPPNNKPAIIPKGYELAHSRRPRRRALEIHYRHILEELGKKPGHAGRDLPQGAEQDSRPGQAQAPDRRPDRQGTMDRLEPT